MYYMYIVVRSPLALPNNAIYMYIYPPIASLIEPYIKHQNKNITPTQSAMELSAGYSYYLASLVVAWAVYRVGLIIYRLTLHPLAKFPGPRIAAASSLYQMYYDVSINGLLPPRTTRSRTNRIMELPRL